MWPGPGSARQRMLQPKHLQRFQTRTSTFRSSPVCAESASGPLKKQESPISPWNHMHMSARTSMVSAANLYHHKHRLTLTDAKIGPTRKAKKSRRAGAGSPPRARLYDLERRISCRRNNPWWRRSTYPPCTAKVALSSAPVLPEILAQYEG